ncbi:MAG: hypothetical protein COZ85_03280 [Candidatus Moranbacteria bacterium CG_4_8_14_3_um_filter_34_16]|nr:MAG: hypothetical protein COT31_04275 [Candidatus Moranbacteria bacterium CG08_land_8_20_14_0_20_34_16]PIW94802.1 MAG: hypothetical protein COZ85_03280 [Candidatus Moranbacteria bacterium CG_4_8_14_3_um_filter_34_16]
MFLKLRPLFYSLIFLGGLELIVFFHRHVLIILLFLMFFSFFQGHWMGRKWSFSVLPVLFSISSGVLLYLITLSFEQQIFILLAFLMYYLSLFGAYRLGQYDGDKTASGMNMSSAMSTLFFVFSSSFGIYLNFLVPLYWLILTYLIATLLVSYQYLIIIKKEDKKIVWIYSFLLALVMGEVIWVLSFWPFGYLTVGTVALIIYYIEWDLIRSYFLENLSRKKMATNFVFFSTMIALILTSSKWLPSL